MLVMVIETFRTGPTEVRERFKRLGRLLPEKVQYLGSWLTPDGRTCYQIMSCDLASDLDPWIKRWKDLVHFEVIPVVESAQFWKSWDSS